jgi:integrase/recombinase XerC
MRKSHEAASIQRCWSTWNVLCTYLYTAERIAANPMPLVGRPKLAKTLPKALPADAVAALLGALAADPQPRRRTDWMQRDRALILTALLAGLRADELVRANVGDLRRTDDGAVVHVRGKGGKDRRIPIEPALVDILERYLDSRAARFPAAAKRRSSPGGGLTAWPTAAPLFVGSEGDRISRGTLQYRVLRAFRRAGIDADRARGALVHGLRHTFATELANAEVSVYTLMKLLGHESMVTSQRYVTAAGTETRAAAAQNKLYDLLAEER